MQLFNEFFNEGYNTGNTSIEDFLNDSANHHALSTHFRIEVILGMLLDAGVISQKDLTLELANNLHSAIEAEENQDALVFWNTDEVTEIFITALEGNITVPKLTLYDDVSDLGYKTLLLNALSETLRDQGDFELVNLPKGYETHEVRSGETKHSFPGVGTITHTNAITSRLGKW